MATMTEMVADALARRVATEQIDYRGLGALGLTDDEIVMYLDEAGITGSQPAYLMPRAIATFRRAAAAIARERHMLNGLGGL